MLLSDWRCFFDKTIIALSGGHFEYFFTFSQNNYTCLGARGVTWTNEVVDTKEDLFIVKMGGIPDLYCYDKKTMNVKFLIEESGRRIKSQSPFRKNLNFPIMVGKKWTDMTTTKPAGGTTEVNYLHEFKVEGLEEVTTQAGAFKTYKIYYKQKNMATGNDGWVRYWYSPEVKAWIKMEVEKSAFWARVTWLQDAELISYELK